jgi:hypothetical protein
VAFLLYKLRKVFPDVVPGTMVTRLRESVLGRAAVYVPTADIQYVTARKEAS